MDLSIIIPLYNEDDEITRDDREKYIDRFIAWAQTIYREQRPYGDFERYSRQLTKNLHETFPSVVMPNNWEMTLGSIKDAWDDTSLLYPEAAIKDALEDVLYDYWKGKEE